jgi:hypothetical protein
MSGLDPGQSLDVYLVFRTTAGTFKTETVSLSTAAMEDLSGLRLMLFGDEDGKMRVLGKEMGAVLLEDEEAWDENAPPTHLVAPSPAAIKADLLLRARQSSVPIVSIEWLKACKITGKLCPHSDFSK